MASAFGNCMDRCNGSATKLAELFDNVGKHLAGNCNKELCGEKANHGDDKESMYGKLRSEQAKALIQQIVKKYTDKELTPKYAKNMTTNYCEYVNSIEALMNSKSKHFSSAEGYELTAYYSACFVMHGARLDQEITKEFLPELGNSVKQKKEIGKRETRRTQQSAYKSSPHGKDVRNKNKIKRRTDSQAGMLEQELFAL